MDLTASHGRLSQTARAFIARKHKLLINGEWVDARSGQTFAVFDPANGQQIAQVAEGAAADVDAAVTAARAAFEDSAWSRMKPTERGRMVWKLGDILQAHGDELAELEALDNGKPISDARAVDIPFSAELLRYMAGWSTKITGQSIPLSAPGDWHAYSMREPVGVVGQIIPWNFPLMMAVWKIAPALATGCTIVLKPAEQTPLTAIRLGELIMEAGFPPGVVNIITGDGTAGAAIAAHPDVDQVYRQHRGRQADRAGGFGQSEEGLPGTRRQIPGHCLPGCRSQHRDPGCRHRHLLQHGPVLHRRLPPVRA
jgi:phenylacetaldehyde dehydrogenase